MTIAAESLLNQGYSAFYKDLVDVFTQVEDALKQAENPDYLNVVSAWQTSDVETKVIEIVKRYTGFTLTQVKLMKSKGPNAFILWKNTWSSKTVPQAMIASMERLYDDKTGLLKDSAKQKLPRLVLTLTHGLFNGFTSVEIASIILHEVGHIDYTVRFERLSQHTLVDTSNILTGLNGNPSVDDIRAIVKIIVQNTNKIPKPYLPAVQSIARYVDKPINVKDAQFLETVSTLAMLIQLTAGAKIISRLQLSIVLKPDHFSTDQKFLDEEANADDYAVRQGAGPGLTSAMAKIHTTNRKVGLDITAVKDSYQFTQWMDNYRKAVGHHIEDVVPIYYPYIQRIEVICQTAMHAFSQSDLSDEVIADLKHQITYMKAYIDGYYSVHRRDTRQAVQRWRNALTTLKHAVFYTTNNLLREQYNQLQQDTRNLSRHGLYYLAKT